ncbi:hypothetical protein EXM65_17835 [Clostridium botulinum]|uniref:Uncharacterized protein n=1 Tax=Clostridium botulinum TaxID=1491 RepID=A0A6M0STL0_CLOBO|nr:hypothetical protein [Clostridium botulinum]NFA44368.1 hypothetical protein [Clostridium botulinum]
MKVYKVDRISDSIEQGIVVIADDKKQARKLIKNKLESEEWSIKEEELEYLELIQVKDVELIDPMNN